MSQAIWEITTFVLEQFNRDAENRADHFQHSGLRELFVFSNEQVAVLCGDYWPGLDWTVVGPWLDDVCSIGVVSGLRVTGHDSHTSVSRGR